MLETDTLDEEIMEWIMDIGHDFWGMEAAFGTGKNAFLSKPDNIE